jgi:preprotein translocase subunit SecA
LEEQWDVPGLEAQIEKDFNLRMSIREWLDKEEGLHEENLRERIHQQIKSTYDKKETQVEPSVLRQFEKAVMLQTLDTFWREHLAAMDYLRQGIHLRGYAQKNPKQEYKRESFELFVELLGRINYQVVSLLSKFEVREEKDVEAVEAKRREASQFKMQYEHASAESSDEMDKVEQPMGAAVIPFTRDERKVGRNEFCPCGSGKKYKHCHGSLS